MEKSQSKNISGAFHGKISKDSFGERVDESLYRNMIGSLLYLTSSRPDIAYTFGVCACYQFSHRVSHLKYVLGTYEYELWYSFDSLYGWVL